MTADTLIERLEAASGPDRELDLDIPESIGNVVDRACPVRWHGDEETPQYTASLDVAMTLVPRGWLMSILRYFDDDGEYFSTVQLTDSFTVGRGSEDEEGVIAIGRKGAGKAFHDPTALALCIASLRARAQAGEKS